MKRDKKRRGRGGDREGRSRGRKRREKGEGKRMRKKEKANKKTGTGGPQGGRGEGLPASLGLWWVTRGEHDAAPWPSLQPARCPDPLLHQMHLPSQTCT